MTADDDIPLADDAALATLEARPATLLRASMFAIIWLGGREAPSKQITAGSGYRASEITEESPHDTASADVTRAAEALGFLYVGQKREGITPIGIASDVWITNDRLAYVTGTQARSRDPIVNTLSRYFILTYFDDGTCVETAGSKTSPIEATAGGLALRGTGSLAADWLTHRAAVAEHCARRGCRVIAVRDHAMVLRLARVFYRQLVPSTAARTILGMFSVGIVALVAAIAGLIRIFL